MSKDEVAEVLQIILDGLTSGKLTEAKLDEAKRFFQKELDKVNKENAFYQRIFRLCMFNAFWSFNMPHDGSDCFNHQKEYSKRMYSEMKDSDVLADFDSFIKSYIETAKTDPDVGYLEGSHD